MMLWWLAMLAGQAAEPPPFDPVTGYRTGHYRAVVPAAPEGVPRVDDAAAIALWRRHGAVFVDVTPAEGAVRDADTGRWTLAQPYPAIPGAHWFPEAGRGQPAEGIDRWFLAGVARLHRAAPGKPIVVFCRADCWMSWNAALRLHRAGYRDVRWFADGLDGWREHDMPIAPAAPEP